MMMMASPELFILDVGHGSCAVLRDTNGTVIIDCALGPTLIDTLSQLHIREIASILISHADQDHIGGVMALLTNEEISIQNVFLNADALRKTKMWKKLRKVLADARKRNATKIHVGLTTQLTGHLDVGQVTIEILAPTPELAMSGVGGEDLHGNHLDSHSMSVVIGLIHDSHRVALLAGDIDEVGLSNLIEEHADVRADILLFPHHGGHPGSGNGERFAQKLCSFINPKLILFSIDRHHFENPREEIIRGIKSAVPTAHIMCTQLSKKCAAQPPTSDFSHLNPLPAKGRIRNSCCGGSISITFTGRKTIDMPQIALHRAFVNDKVSTPMCLRLPTKERETNTM